MQFLRIPNLKSVSNCFWNLFFHLDSLFNNLRFSLPILSSLLLTLLQSEAVIWWCSVKKVFQQILQISQESTCSKYTFLIKLQIYSLTFSKKSFQHRCFLVNSGKFLIKPFLKNPSNGCFHRNTCSVCLPRTTLYLFCLLPNMTFYLYKNNDTHIFQLSIFSA